jgi:hypothetical protein
MKLSYVHQLLIAANQQRDSALPGSGREAEERLLLMAESAMRIAAQRRSVFQSGVIAKWNTKFALDLRLPPAIPPLRLIA